MTPELYIYGDARLAEAQRQERLAYERLESDIVRAAGHSGSAWDAADEAEAQGTDPAVLLAFRVRMLRFAIGEWLPRANAHAATLSTPAARAGWYRSIAAALRAGAIWCEAAIARGELAIYAHPDTMALWLEEIDRAEQAARKAEAS